MENMISERLDVVAQWPLTENQIHHLNRYRKRRRKPDRESWRLWVQKASQRYGWTNLEEEAVLDYTVFRGPEHCLVAIRHPTWEDTYKIPSPLTGKHIPLWLPNWTANRILRKGLQQAEKKEQETAKFIGEGYYGP